MAVRPSAEAEIDASVAFLIVGGGACGLTAALAAADAGLETLVLERDTRPSGSTSLSSGLIPAVGTRLQRELGEDDSPEIFVADIIAKTNGQVDNDVVRAVAEISGPTIDWLERDHGLTFTIVDGFLYPGHTRRRMHGPPSQTGADLEAMLLEATGRAGIDVMTGASVEDIFAAPDGRVVAVGVRRPNGAVETIGCHDLLLACSGFGGDRELVRRHTPEIADAEYCGHASNTGDALRWGEALGAATADLDSYQGHGSVPRPHAAPLPWAVITLGGFQVNARGQRFANEMAGYSEHAVEVMRQPGGFAWNVYDARSEAPAIPFADYKEMQRLGAIKSADTLDEVARITGVPGDALRETFADVARCAVGDAKDPLGRDFTTSPTLSPPYRVARISGALFHTQGGLVIDTAARVLRPDGTPLPNLFAGGGAARGVSGPGAGGYMAGNGLLTATMLGRIAALTVAARTSNG